MISPIGKQKAYNYFDVRRDSFDGCGYPSNEAPTPRGNDDGLNISHLLQDLQTHRARSRYDVWVVVSAQYNITPKRANQDYITCNAFQRWYVLQPNKIEDD